MGPDIGPELFYHPLEFYPGIDAGLLRQSFQFLQDTEAVRPFKISRVTPGTATPLVTSLALRVAVPQIKIGVCPLVDVVPPLQIHPVSRIV
jgi:hypothetical protein